MDLYNMLSWVESVWNENDNNQHKNRNNIQKQKLEKNDNDSEVKQTDESDEKSLQSRLSFDDLPANQVCIAYPCTKQEINKNI